MYSLFIFPSLAATHREAKRSGGLLNLLMNQIRWEQFKCCTEQQRESAVERDKNYRYSLKWIIAIARSIYMFKKAVNFLPGMKSEN